MGRQPRSRGSSKMAPLVFGICVALSLGVLLAGCSSGRSPRTSGTSANTASTGAVSSLTTDGGSAFAANSAAPPGSNSGEPSSESAVYPNEAAYDQSGGNNSEEGQVYSTSENDKSAILVSDGGSYSLSDGSVQTSGSTSSDDSSSFYGLNAAVVATSGSSISLAGGSITTTGSGANAAFATGEGSSVNLSNVVIEATGDGGHGVMATQGGTVTLDSVRITTAGANSAPLATDRGGGAITATASSAVCSGQDSPAIYSTGSITVSGGSFQASGAEAAVIEGGNSISLKDAALSSTVADKWGLMIYQSTSGDAEGSQGTFTMEGGWLTYSGVNGPLFYVTNSTGLINLSGVQLKYASGVLVKAAAGDWGTSGSNGGAATLVADGQQLSGDLIADSVSSVALALQNSSSFTGSVNPDEAARQASLSLDATSIWNVTADSYLTVLTLAGEVAGTSISSIIGNGHAVFYDATNPANSALAGKTYALGEGGTLRPMD
jgi:hypothetical protein